MASTSPPIQKGRTLPLLTGGAIVDLGVRSSPQELHRNPPKLGDHCNGSQETVSAGRSPWSPPHTTEPPSAAASPNPRCPLAAGRPGAPYAPRTNPAASSRSDEFPRSAQTPPSPLPGLASKREEAPAPQHPELSVPAYGSPTLRRPLRCMMLAEHSSVGKYLVKTWAAGCTVLNSVGDEKMFKHPTRPLVELTLITSIANLLSTVSGIVLTFINTFRVHKNLMR